MGPKGAKICKGDFNWALEKPNLDLYNIQKQATKIFYTEVKDRS